MREEASETKHHQRDCFSKMVLVCVIKFEAKVVTGSFCMLRLSLVSGTWHIFIFLFNSNQSHSTSQHRDMLGIIWKISNCQRENLV